MHTGEGFPRDYTVADVDTWPADLVLGVEGGSIHRVVSVVPSGQNPAWTAGLSTTRPLVNRACSGNVATPRPDVVLLVDRGVAFWVEVADPQSYQVLPTFGEVVQIVPAVDEGVLLLVTPWAITAVTGKPVEWTTRRIAIDGLRVDAVSAGLVHGVADPLDEEPRPFSVSVATGHVEGGSIPS